MLSGFFVSWDGFTMCMTLQVWARLADSHEVDRLARAASAEEKDVLTLQKYLEGIFL